MATRYKLLNADQTSHGETLWAVGEWLETSGVGSLCGPGWLHCYGSPEVAEFMNPRHGNFPPDAVLWEVEVDGESQLDGQLKEGWTRMRVVKEHPRFSLTREQRVEIAIRLAAKVNGIEL